MKKSIKSLLFLSLVAGFGQIIPTQLTFQNTTNNSMNFTMYFPQESGVPTPNVYVSLAPKQSKSYTIPKYATHKLVISNIQGKNTNVSYGLNPTVNSTLYILNYGQISYVNTDIVQVTINKGKNLPSNSNQILLSKYSNFGAFYGVKLGEKRYLAKGHTANYAVLLPNNTPQNLNHKQFSALINKNKKPIKNNLTLNNSSTLTMNYDPQTKQYYFTTN